MNDYIVVIKLINGQDVFAVIVDEDDTIVEVEFPFLATYSSSAGGAVMSPFSLYSDETNYRFRIDSILCISKATDKVAEYYLELTQQYSDYLDKKFTVESLSDYLDGLDSSDLDDLGEEESNALKVGGNNTRH